MKQQLLNSVLMGAIMCTLLPSGVLAEPNQYIAKRPTPDSIFSIEADSARNSNFFFVTGHILPFNPAPRSDYSVSLKQGKGTLISPSWVLTASHIVSWNEQKYPETLLLHSSDLLDARYRGRRVFRHPYKDLALIQLETPIPEEREPVLLMYDTLDAQHGEVLIKEVGENQHTSNMLVQSGEAQDMLASDMPPTARPYSSGTSWVIESPLSGDILTAVSNNAGKAQQVAYAKHWIEQIVSANTPNEMLYWVGINKALPDYQEPEAPASTPAQPSLIVLP